MKEYINRFARGSFLYHLPQINILPQKVEEKVALDTQTEFQLKIQSTDTVKGLIYSSNERVAMDTNTFYGTENVISYQVNTVGLICSDSINGKFTIVSSAGEVEISYCFQVEEQSYETSEGSTANLFEFASLLEKSPKEAETLFLSETFSDVFLHDTPYLRNLYEVLRKQANTQLAIEEFLLAGKKKAPVRIQAENLFREYKDLTENHKDSLVIERSTWGYMNLSIQTDCDFIQLSKNELTQEDFTGNKYDFEFIICQECLHKGNNYGRITISSGQQTIVLDIKASAGGMLQQNYEKRHALLLLTKEYLNFRFKKSDLRQWIEQSNQILDLVRGIDQDDVYFKLVQAQMYFTQKRPEEGQWLLDHIKDQVFQEIDSHIEQYCYYLYVNSLAQRSEEYTAQVVKIITKYYENGHDNFRMLWLLFYLDADQYSNKSVKLARIKDIYREGCTSPIMYLEALSVMNAQPVLLRVLNDFEYQVIHFGCKYQSITKELALQVCQIIQNEKVANRRYLHILNTLYQMYEEDEILSVLVAHLIRNELVGEEYLPLYEKGILRGLKITRLYEYYMMSLKSNQMKRLPKMVLMYFVYDSELEYHTKAYLYANIITNGTCDPDVLKNYELQIEHFAYEQIRLGHIDPYLEIIYKYIWGKQLVSKDTADFMCRYLFTYKISCFDSDIVRVYVKHKELDEYNCYPVINKIAYVPIYTEDSAICFEYLDGNVRKGSVQYELERLCSDMSTLEALKEFCIEDLYLGIYLFEDSVKSGRKDEITEKNCLKIMKNEHATKQIKMRINSWLIQYYYENYTGNEFEVRFQELSKEHLSATDAVKLIEICIMNGMYEDAYELVQVYGYQDILPERLFKLVKYLIGIETYRTQRLLVDMAGHVFESGKYEEDILTFLVSEYNGSNDEMYQVYKSAVNFEVDSNQIEERIVAQMMFTGEHNGRLTEVFRAYQKTGGNDRLIDAYVAYQSYQYFVKHKNANDIVFTVLEHNLLASLDYPEVCKLALLQHYSEHVKDGLSDEQLELCDKILKEMCKEEKFFSFYHKFDSILDLPYNAIDKTSVTYYGSPDSKVLVHYTMPGDTKEHTQILKCFASGVYLKAFTLFYGESLQYYFTEEQNGKVIESEHQTIVSKQVSLDNTNGRFEYLNDMLASRELHDIVTLKKLMNEYCVNEYLTEQVFKPM